MMTKEEVEARMNELEKYLNLLTTNKVALSTKYFTEFFELYMKVFSVFVCRIV